MREVVYSGLKLGLMAWYKFRQISSKKLSKSMKNIRFGSGFLHVIRKLIPQQDPNEPIALKSFVSEK